MDTKNTKKEISPEEIIDSFDRVENTLYRIEEKLYRINQFLNLITSEVEEEKLQETASDKDLN